MQKHPAALRPRSFPSVSPPPKMRRGRDFRPVAVDRQEVEVGLSPRPARSVFGRPAPPRACRNRPTLEEMAPLQPVPLSAMPHSHLAPERWMHYARYGSDMDKSIEESRRGLRMLASPRIGLCHQRPSPLSVSFPRKRESNDPLVPGADWTPAFAGTTRGASRRPGICIGWAGAVGCARQSAWRLSRTNGIFRPRADR